MSLKCGNAFICFFTSVSHRAISTVNKFRTFELHYSLVICSRIRIHLLNFRTYILLRVDAQDNISTILELGTCILSKAIYCLLIQVRTVSTYMEQKSHKIIASAFHASFCTLHRVLPNYMTQNIIDMSQKNHMWNKDDKKL